MQGNRQSKAGGVQAMGGRIPRKWVRIYKILLWFGVCVLLASMSCRMEWGVLGGIALMLLGLAVGWWKCRCSGCGSPSVLQHLRYSDPGAGYCPRCGRKIRYDDDP